MQAFITTDPSVVHHLQFEGINPDNQDDISYLYWDLPKQYYYLFDLIEVCYWPDGDWDYVENMTSMDSIAQFKSDDYQCVYVPYWAEPEQIDEFIPFWLQSDQTVEDSAEWWNSEYQS